MCSFWVIASLLNFETNRMWKYSTFSSYAVHFVIPQRNNKNFDIVLIGKLKH